MCNRALLLFGKMPQRNLYVNCHVNGTRFQSALRFQTGLSSLRVSCKRALSVDGSKQGILNSFKRDLAKRIYIKLGVYEFLNIHIFNWYKALYSASSSTFQHLDFIRAARWLRAVSPMVCS